MIHYLYCKSNNYLKFDKNIFFYVITVMFFSIKQNICNYVKIKFTFHIIKTRNIF